MKTRHYIIGQDGNHAIGERLFWNNDLGWVGREDATTFRPRERESGSLSLPMGGKWIEVIPMTIKRS